MPTIHLTTFIKAPAPRVFDLSRSIDLHKKSMAKSNETAVSGTISGLISKDETVTWKARHLGKMRILKTRISEMIPTISFTDEMVTGDFKSMRHEHHFKTIENGTFMIDIFDFQLPYGNAGKILSALYLTKYLRRLLETRNQMIREYAESEKWTFILNK